MNRDDAQARLAEALAECERLKRDKAMLMIVIQQAIRHPENI